jgi:hypothetical protein
MAGWDYTLFNFERCIYTFDLVFLLLTLVLSKNSFSKEEKDATLAHINTNKIAYCTYAHTFRA